MKGTWGRRTGDLGGVVAFVVAVEFWFPTWRGGRVQDTGESGG